MKRENTTVCRLGYAGYVRTSFRHALTVTLRHRRILLANALVLSPVLIPVGLAFLTLGRYGGHGDEIFAVMVEQLYLKAMAPLLALFFGCMLLGEDIESHTAVYFLTRPLPRSAWIMGRFGAYQVVSAAILLPSIGLAYVACTGLGGLEMDREGLVRLAHYGGVSVMALTGYGALCVLLGALVRRPVVFGVVWLFGWERMANVIPGLVDFLTIGKYVAALLPRLDVARERPAIHAALAVFEVTFKKQEFAISAERALITLFAVTVCLLFLTTYAIRRREYASARSMGG